MSTFTMITNLTEVIVDDNMDYVDEYTEDLPHHDIIVKNACDDWNKANMLQYYDTPIVKDKIKSCIMRGKKTSDGETELHIVFTMNPNVRLTEKVKNELRDLTSAQLSDGWGEGFFGLINVMNDGNGTRFYVE